MNLKEIAMSNGFDSFSEYATLISRISLNKPHKKELFERWKREDGTKAALLCLFPEIRESIIDRKELDKRSVNPPKINAKFIYEYFFNYKSGMIKVTSYSEVYDSHPAVLVLQNHEIKLNGETVNLQEVEIYRDGIEILSYKIEKQLKLLSDKNSHDLKEILASLMSEISEIEGYRVQEIEVLEEILGMDYYIKNASAISVRRSEGNV